YVDNMEGVTILRDTPYVRSNSAQLGNSMLEYRNQDSNDAMGVFPDNYNITMQFRPDANFFYGTNGIYNDIIPITSFTIDKEPNDGVGDIQIFAHRYSIVSLKPELGSGDNIVTQTFPSPPEGEENTATQIYLAADIDLSQQSYIL